MTRPTFGTETKPAACASSVRDVTNSPGQQKGPRQLSRAFLQSRSFRRAGQRTAPVVIGATVAVFSFGRGVTMLTWCGEGAEVATWDSRAFAVPNKPACTGDIGRPFTSYVGNSAARLIVAPAITIATAAATVRGVLFIVILPVDS
jgi:hypothetical protein